MRLQVLIDEQPLLLRSPLAMVWNTLLMPSACPCARQATAMASAMAVVTIFWDWPSACSSSAFLSCSADFSLSMASWIADGGSRALSSARLTRRPHAPVASSSSFFSSLLNWSRELSAVFHVHPGRHIPQRGVVRSWSAEL